jgi:hypothetical protein
MSLYRQELLLKMYDQLFNDINRHIVVIWQSISVLVGAFAIFALVEKNIISIDLASAIIVLLSAWLLSHLYDSAYWYNRNLTMIANIERLFLEKEDLKHVHYYFGKHRPVNSMLTHLKIQFALGLGMCSIVLLYHFTTRIVPGFGASFHNIDPVRSLPYIVVLASFFFLKWIRKNRRESYKEFLKNSPGIEIDTNGLDYGVGHGRKAKDNKALTADAKNPRD